MSNGGRANSGMPGRGLGGGLGGEQSGAAIGLVQRRRARGGRWFYDVFDPDTLQQWRDVPILTWGGSEGTAAFFPVDLDRAAQGENDSVANPDETTGAQVVMVFRAQNRQRPVIVGAVHHSSWSLLAEPPDVEADADHPGQAAEGDFAWHIGGITVLLDRKGRAVVDLREAGDTTYRVQLADDGHFRISRNGQASERLLLAGPTRAAFDALVDRVNTIGQALSSLKVSGQATLTNTYELQHVDAAKSTDAMVSATIKVSADSEA